MEEFQTQPTRLRFWEMLIGTFIAPSDTLPQIAQQRSVGAALGFIITLSIVGYVLEVVLPDKNVALGITAPRGFSIIKMIRDVGFSLLFFTVFASLVHGFISLFRDEGSYRGIFCALAFTWAPVIVLYLINILASFSYQPLWPWPTTLLDFSSTEIFGILLVILIIAWIVILGIMAIRSQYGIRAMGAIVAYILAAILAAIVGGVISRAIEKVFELF